jgi:AraC-like DNA-binding protein
MKITRWARHSRVLPAREVDGYFDAEPDSWLLFAFETSRMTVDPHTGNFSLKLVASGEERYNVDGTIVTLTPGKVMLVNGGQRYASGVDGTATRAISLFVPDRAVRDLHGSVPEVHAAPFAPAARDTALVRRLDHTLRTPIIDGGIVEELAIQLLGGVLDQYRGLVSTTTLADRRRSTRDELIRRVMRAREFINDTGGKVRLDAVAASACLSKYYLIRVFRDACGVTPMEFARRVRLDRAAAVAGRGGDRSQVLRAGGFKSMSGLRRARRKQTG